MTRPSEVEKLSTADRRVLLGLAGLFAALATLYSVITPVFEASDEISHFPVVEHIARTGSLPVQQPGTETLWEQEGSQPPLYYLLAAALVAPLDTGDLEAIRWRNPHAKLGVPLQPDNKNMIIHTEAEAWPWRGTVLAIHLVRLFSVALSTASVALIYLLAREIWPTQQAVPILACFLVVLNPMFLFISGSVNNDNLTVLLASWSMLLALRIVRHGITSRRAATLAVVAALATITKVSGLTLLPVIGLALLYHALVHRDWKGAIYTGLALIAAWMALASWWYIRNLVVYGELFGINTHVAIAGTREIGLWELRKEWFSFWASYWGLFGAVNILMPDWVYAALGLLVATGAVGVSIWVVRQVRNRAWSELVIPGLLLVQIAITFIALVRWTMITYASQGRLMFPAIGGISTLLAVGILWMFRERWQRIVTAAVGVLMGAMSITAPFTLIAPTYAIPEPVAAVPEDAIPVKLFYDDLEIVAIRPEGVITQEGGWLPITLYVRANAPMGRDISLYMQVLGRDEEEIGKIDTYPGGGALPTSRMQPGAIYGTRYLIELAPRFAAPTGVRVIAGAGVFNADSYSVLPPYDEDGKLSENAVIEAGVAYPSDMARCGLPSNADEPIGYFADTAVLFAPALPTTASAGDSIPVVLLWDALTPTASDLSVFVHLVGVQEQQPAAQADGPPLGGNYPTRLWMQRCAFYDEHVLTVPADTSPGDYRVLVGLYDLNDPQYTRLPASAPDGAPYPDYAVPLGVIRVEGN